MRQYLRQFSLNLGNEKESIIIDNLRVSFDIEKNSNSEPNNGSIFVYNLNEKNRNRISSGEFNKAILAVGYEQPRVIYGGDVLSVVQHREDLDFITELILGDGQKDIEGAMISVTVKSGSTDADIIKECLKTMPNTETEVIELPNKRALPRSKVMNANTRDILTGVAKNQNADWSIQDGALIILPKDKVLSDNEGFVLNQNTGMIGSPQRTNDGMEVRCLLNASMQIGGLVRVESIIKEYNGDYKITKLQHKGDISTNDWTTIITCIGGEFQKVEKAKK